jgi:hypothetical protein
VDRYSFIVVDLHHLLLAGLPAHFESYVASHAVGSLTEFAELAEEVDPHVFKLRARRQSQHSPRAGGGSKESPGHVMRTCGSPPLVIQRPWFARLIEALIRAGVVEVGTVVTRPVVIQIEIGRCRAASAIIA